MHRIDTPTAQVDKFGTGKNGFTRGNPQTATPATDLDDDYFDAIQEELAGVIEATGVALDKTKRNQLLTALKELLLSRAHPFADIKSDGAAAVAEALANLGLGDGSALPVGVPVPWPLAVPPAGWIKYNGATFDKVANPKLAAVYPAGVLPDMRGYVPRGWDDGRGIDTGRALLSVQSDAIRNITGKFQHSYGGSRAFFPVESATGAMSTGNPASPADIGSIPAAAVPGVFGSSVTFDAGQQVPVAAENRMKNIAFNWIVRAA